MENFFLKLQHDLEDFSLSRLYQQSDFDFLVRLLAYLKINRTVAPLTIRMCGDLEYSSITSSFENDYTNFNELLSSIIKTQAEEYIYSDSTITHPKLADIFFDKLVEFLAPEKRDQIFSTYEMSFKPLVLSHASQFNDFLTIKKEDGLLKNFFYFLGFNLSQEFSGNSEYLEIDNIFQEKLPEMRSKLLKTVIEYEDKKFSAYTWVKLHTVVESLHAEEVKKSVVKAVNIYEKYVDKEILISWVEEGCKQFSSVMKDFVDTIIIAEISEGQK